MNLYRCRQIRILVHVERSAVGVGDFGDGDALCEHLTADIVGIFAHSLISGGIRGDHNINFVSYLKSLTLADVLDAVHEFAGRQYVNSANRESAMFEQALVVYAKKGGGVETEVTDETRERFEQAFSRMLALTDVVRTELIRRLVHQSFKDMEG